MDLAQQELDDSPTSWWTKIRELASAHGFARAGVAALTRPTSIDIYEAWLAKGFAGEMSYLERHLPQKKDPTLHFARARSALVVAVDYLPHPHPDQDSPVSAARVARYARGQDYHEWLQASLEGLANALRSEFPKQKFLCCSDSAPILERDLAARAGLGWVGKNTCLIDRNGGSLFLLGEILTTLPAPAAEIDTRDFCGTCTRCLDACPTGALTAPRSLDARLCISYLTIEAKSVPPQLLRTKMDDWLFGCDICQTVCPWNVKAYGPALADAESNRETLIAELSWIMRSSNGALERAFAGSPLARARGFGLKRNAMIVAANRGLSELSEDIAIYLEDKRLGELAVWTLARLADKRRGAPDPNKFD